MKEADNLVAAYNCLKELSATTGVITLVSAPYFGRPIIHCVIQEMCFSVFSFLRYHHHGHHGVCARSHRVAGTQ